MQRLVFTNGGGQTIDLTSGNFGITNWEGLSGADLNIQTQQVPFQDGGVFLDALLEQREISVTVAIQDNNDLSLRYELKRQLISALNPKFGEGVLVYTNDYLSRQIKAVPQLPIFENKNSNDSGTLKASVAFTCCSPYWEDLEDTVVPIMQNKRTIIQNNGDVNVGVKIKMITSQVTNPEIQNLEENKKIEIEGSYTQNINIDTNVGNKNINLDKDMEFDILGGVLLDGYCITYSKKLDLFCAGCYNGILISKDGKKWSVGAKGINLANAFYCYGITYSEELEIFVAVGSYDFDNTGVIYTSTDGIEWTLRLDQIPILNGVTYSEELNIFCVVGEEGAIYTSPDGINWTLRTSGVSDTIYSICYSDTHNIFCAGLDNKVLTSSNGTSWTSQTSGLSNFDVKTVIFAEDLNLFVAGGTKGIVTSTYGTTWDLRSSIRIGINNIKYIDSIKTFYAIGEDGILSSVNGINWKTDLEESGNSLSDIAYSKTLGILCVIGKYTPESQGFYFLLSNGNSWEENYLQAIEKNVFYSKTLNKYLYIGQYSYSSNDGINWKAENFIVQSSIKSIAINTKQQIYLGIDYNKKVYRSNDGLNWSVTEELAQSLNKIVYSPKLNLFCIVGNNGYIATSPDGITWIQRYTDVTNNISAICWSEKQNQFVAVTDNDTNTRYIISNDGINWQSGIIGNIGFKAIAYTEDLDIYMAVGAGIYISYDGKTWRGTRTQTTPVMNDVIYSKSQMCFYIGGNNATLLKSKDGITFETIEQDISMNIEQLNIIDTLGILYVENAFMVLYSKTETYNNLISKLSSDSDMTLSLNKGNNSILLSCTTGNIQGYISFRQKYIGV